MRGAKQAENRISRISIHAHQHSWWRMSGFSRESHLAVGTIGLKFVKSTGKRPEKASYDKCNVHFGGKAGTEDRHIAVQDIQTSDKGDAEGIRQIEISYVPGSGRIAGIEFREGRSGEMDAGKSLPSLYWRQWERDDSKGEPEGLKRIVQGPPSDGDRWRFVGLCGHFDQSFLGGSVLSRVSGIWRRVSES